MKKFILTVLLASFLVSSNSFAFVVMQPYSTGVIKQQIKALFRVNLPKTIIRKETLDVSFIGVRMIPYKFYQYHFILSLEMPSGKSLEVNCDVTASYVDVLLENGFTLFWHNLRLLPCKDMKNTNFPPHLRDAKAYYSVGWGDTRTKEEIEGYVVNAQNLVVEPLIGVGDPCWV